MDNNQSSVNVSWWNAHKPTKRRIIQLYSALLYNAHLRGFAEGQIFTGKSKAVCVPGFNCYSCPGAIGACPLGSIQNALGSLNKHIGFYVLGIILLYGMLLGRTICGWICPLGMLQELLHKIPTPKLKKSRFTRALSYLKYIIIVIFVVSIPVYYGIFQGIPVPGFCKYICPAGTSEGAMLMIPKNPSFLSMLGPIFTQKFIIMVIVILACIFCYRSFCRFLCPLGAIYGIFNKLSVIGVKVDANRCSGYRRDLSSPGKRLKAKDRKQTYYLNDWQKETVYVYRVLIPGDHDPVYFGVVGLRNGQLTNRNKKLYREGRINFFNAGYGSTKRGYAYVRRIN